MRRSAWVMAVALAFISTWALASRLWVKTQADLRALPPLATVATLSNKPTLLDRNGKPLHFSLERGWNVNDQIALHQAPDLLQKAFILSEDKRFFSHAGVDWTARFHAAWQAITRLHFVRGASTLSEQVARMVHPRPRNLWSKWLEGLETYALEKQESKINLLEFYLNQVPYGAERRGIKQAAQLYFSRDLDTLSPKEMLALVVIARAPSIYGAPKNIALLESRIAQLSDRLKTAAILTEENHQQIKNEKLAFVPPAHVYNAYHFAQYVWRQPSEGVPRITTTLDPELQQSIEKLLEQRLKQLAVKNVQNGAVLVADHQTHEILSWVVSGDIQKKTAGAFIDAVTTPRQPGSTLKPFVYAMALEKGWTAATIIKDEPLQEAVGAGIHSYRNYSKLFYGDLTVRETLANSLNIPAVKTLDYVGQSSAIEHLRRMGMEDLSKHPGIYGDGLALGNGEVTLLELVQAYTVLADRGLYRPLRFLPSDSLNAYGDKLFSPETTSIISNILADTSARQLEFGAGNSLSFSVETAAKTGTSTDHCDAWIIAYNYRYVVGIWLGNLNRQHMLDVTGSTGPALLAHAVFSELNRGKETQALYLSPTLVKQSVCTALSKDNTCLYRDEWFAPGTEPQAPQQLQNPKANPPRLAIQKPSDGLHLAMDPRIPDALEAFEFSLNQENGIRKVEWYLDGSLLTGTHQAKWLWPLSRGAHHLFATVTQIDGNEKSTDTVSFFVK